MKFSKRMMIWLTAVLALALLAGCRSKDDDEDEAAAEPEAGAVAKGPAFKPTGNEGNIVGVIAFNGAAPAAKKLSLDSDPVCAQKNPNAVGEEVVVADGKLQNVFVYVKGGLPRATFEAPTAEVTLDQSGCHYVPHVLGLQTNQPLKVVNSDNTNHNVHPTPKDNREWNESQGPGAPPIVKKFTRAEVLIPVKCNQHAWMKAWVGVLDHPFYAVSGKDGAFTIKGLPPGEYDVEAWHEKLGAKTMKVKVADKADAKADFTFDAATAYHAGSLKMQPALVVP